MTPPRYTPYASGAHKLSVGLAPLDPATWFEPDRQWAEQMANKAAMLRFQHGDVVAALPGSEAAQVEVLAAMTAHLPEAHPQLYLREGEHLRIQDLHPGGANNPALSAIDRCGRMVQEDLCLMQQDGSAFVLTAASLCAPSGWKLSEKLGQPLLGIHAPVPGYDVELAHRVQRVFQGLQPGKAVWRTNWSLATEPTLFMPGGHSASPVQGDAVTPQNAGTHVWLRVERQTLTRLPQSGAILFTIKTYIDPLSALACHGALCAGLKGSVETMTPDMRDYKAISRYKAALIAWLDAQLGLST
jgi:dimethylamine monooxygenase subunit A